ncbi:MAG TPA: carboxypeptidase regulatory-like domain-containing protein, partial [Leptospiraceae bacterium]|nr:carboxypeptidase regulatory-like domain-containing protein [Leptospiraceae bacterium]
MLKKMTSLFLILVFSGTAYCSKKKKKNWVPLALVGSAVIAGGNGSITGRTVRKKVTGTPAVPLSEVEVLADITGKTFKIKSSSDGTFSLAVSGAVRGSGTTAFFRKDSFAESARAITFDIPNLRVDLGDVEVLTQDEANSLPLGTSDSGTGPIVKGQIIDDFTSNPLDQASINISIASGTTLPAVTDSTGSFTIQNSKLKAGSSYNITVSKQNYLESSNVTVNVTGDTNTINGNPIRLYRAYGNITGTVIDDSGAPLAGVSVSAVDSKGATASGATDSSGNFTLTSNAFLLGSDYTLSITKSGYSSLTSTVPISITGNNTLTPNPFVLTISGTISGTVGTASCGNVTLSFTDSNGNPVSTTVTGGSTYTLNNTLTAGQNGIKKGQSYSITAVSSGSPGCETAVVNTSAVTEGTNSLNISLTARVACGGGNTCIAGKVVDASDTASALQGITVSTTDSVGTTRTATTSAAGTFSLAGTFNNGATFSLSVSASGYTGAASTAGQTIPVQVTVAAGLTHNIVHNGDSTLFNLATSDIKLYPIGISATIGGSKKKFYQGVKQTYEKFLTEKWGFTVSGRDVTDLNTASSFYIHTDDVSQPPSSPGSYCSGYTYRHSNIMAVNGNVSKGVIQESNNDPRACNTPIRGATGGGSDPG